MKKSLLTSLIGAALFSNCITVNAELASLRGPNNLDAPAEAIEKKKQQKMQGGFDRAWELQPPSIPHSIEKDRITLRENTCMKCHSKDNFEQENAPEISESHYIARDGTESDKLSSRRHFCNLCHTPQVDAEPLVENNF